MRLILAVILAGACSLSCSDGGQVPPERIALTSAGHMPPLMAIAQLHPDSARCAALRPGDPLATSRAGFLQEVLDARATARTPLFDDYHRGSYHVDKQDVATGLVQVSRACGTTLRGVVILGPVGPLWAYYVLAFLEESPRAIRVNQVLMPHARITDKQTGTITPATFDSVVRALAEAPLMEPRPRPRAARPDTSALGSEFGYDLLMLRIVGDSLAEWSAHVQQTADTASARRTVEPIDAVLKRLAPTYTDSATRAHRDRDT